VPKTPIGPEKEGLEGGKGPVQGLGKEVNLRVCKGVGKDGF